ncbi:hypothetical protein S7711_05234 [Stachybotrys chartarum IBT 7711]|uniref:Phosphotransferase n=1 Tax=Stachybotrys chartarum (strain CBS 109288 / IBT 7711) TaxID=1280523 RepID=A0A084ANK1_STACB|nr:hypothetical protein S7711_05234 [Stachybotrys chartarum IBT 7711]KFA47788.1 hypothetical protein S40293_09027 [Stachybotrys chartarum IBT 40293]KFA76853.1 hypothetical protein S40288_03000 [Stachybotrys chartarum IBT 40288]
MSDLRKSFIAAIVKSLIRGKSLIQALLSFWISPLVIETVGKPQITTTPIQTVQEFLKEAEASLIGPVSGDGLLQLSTGLKKQFLERLLSDPQCMIPSYVHQLPTGLESGQYLALDVGGSTLRVALVGLRGSKEQSRRVSEIISIRSFSIDKTIKHLEGMAFFDWMAGRIVETLSTTQVKEEGSSRALPIALSWSFPIEQTSLGSGKLQGMGKGFYANKGLIGQDLKDIVRLACQHHGLEVELQAILNDSSACLLSQSYSHVSTRFGVILGTGVNIAAYLPTSIIGRFKFGQRPPSWFEEASHVIVNTELGMFGHHMLPLMKWDIELLEGHPRPDFQPLEHLVSGMYLGELGRLALVDAIQSTGIFGGVVPPSLTTPYTMGADMLAAVESDISSDLVHARRMFAERHPSTQVPTAADMSVLRSLASFISVRSSAILATCVYTLWDLRLDSQQSFIETLPAASQAREEAEAELRLPITTVSCNGSIVEKYPGYFASFQRYVNQLVQGSGRAEVGDIELVPAEESALLGAAVALACVN